LHGIDKKENKFDRYGRPSRRFVAAGFSTMTTSQIMPWAFPRKVYRGERLANHVY
jgi:hypothetical protein